MTDEISPSELGAFTNNLSNKEGIKKLCEKVNSGGGSGDAYTKAETDALLNEKQDVLTAGDGISINESDVISTKGWEEHLFDEENFNLIDENNYVIKDTLFIISSFIADSTSATEISDYAQAYLLLRKGNKVSDYNAIPFIAANIASSTYEKIVQKLDYMYLTKYFKTYNKFQMYVHRPTIITNKTTYYELDDDPSTSVYVYYKKSVINKTDYGAKAMRVFTHD